jgi:predicted MFS family arabinose efflux permease
MRHENGTPTNRRRRLHAALYTMVALAFGLAGLVGVVGPGRAIDWIVTYLIPVVAILGVVVWLYFLLRRGDGRDYYDGQSYEKWYDRF